MPNEASSSKNSTSISASRAMPSKSACRIKASSMADGFAVTSMNTSVQLTQSVISTSVHTAKFVQAGLFETAHTSYTPFVGKAYANSQLVSSPTKTPFTKNSAPGPASMPSNTNCPTQPSTVAVISSGHSHPNNSCSTHSKTPSGHSSDSMNQQTSYTSVTSTVKVAVPSSSKITSPNQNK